MSNLKIRLYFTLHVNAFNKSLSKRTFEMLSDQSDDVPEKTVCKCKRTKSELKCSNRDKFSLRIDTNITDLNDI